MSCDKNTKYSRKKELKLSILKILSGDNNSMELVKLQVFFGNRVDIENSLHPLSVPVRSSPVTDNLLSPVHRVLAT